MSTTTLDNIMNKLADVYYPIGHYVITGTNTNPNSLGIKGTWELKSKSLRRNLVEIIGTSGTLGTFFTPNSTNFTLNDINIRGDGSTIYLKITGYNKVALTDTAVTIGSLNFSLLGDNIGGYWSYTYGQIYNANVMFFVTTEVTGGDIKITDIVANNSATSYAAQSSRNIYINIPLMLVTNNGLYYEDELCDQFYWLRTA